MKWVSEVRGRRWRTTDGAYSIIKMEMKGGRIGYLLGHHPMSVIYEGERRHGSDHAGTFWDLADAKRAARDHAAKVTA